MALLATLSVALVLASPAAAKFGFLHTWGSAGSGNGQFEAPWGIATDASGNVYVADLGNHRFQKFGPIGDVRATVGSQGPGDLQFRRPTGIAVNTAGEIYVTEEGPTASYDTEQVRAFSPSLSFSHKWTRSVFKQPKDLATDASAGVYLVDGADGYLSKWTVTGQNATLIWERPGACNTPVLSECDDPFDGPVGLAVDSSQGFVYVADLNNNRVVKFNTNGAFIRTWGSGLNHPRDVATDAAGNVYVMDTGNARLKKFTGIGAFLSQWGDGGTAPGQFSFATKLAVAPNGDVYISDTSNNRIQVFGELANTRITRGPRRRTANRTARFRFRSSRAGSRFQCKLKGRDVRPRLRRFRRCNPPKRYRRLEPGRKVFKVRAIDQFGNRDRTPAKHVWRVTG